MLLTPKSQTPRVYTGERSLKELQELKELGVTLAIDDFGTGYASLSYLKQLPIDRIKIDRSFVRDVSYDSGDQAITKAIVGIGNSLNLKVVAEGVETKDQLTFLRRLDCNEVQGFYYSPPVPNDAIPFLCAQSP